MAYTSDFSSREKGIFKALSGTGAAVLSWLGAALRTYMEKRSRLEEVLRFDAMSDDALAARGLTRDGIVAHVFRDKFVY